MIPIKLRIRNFMPFRDKVPALHFDGIHTACISGDNGNGKSALIDAMTWALWGKTRAASDDDLIHQGQTETEVEFDFAVGQQPYRIIRKRSRPKRRGSAGQTILEFQITSGDGFRSITGNSASQTQQRITEILHMDYSTFINSAFLRQGHADEFTQQPPAKRKEVLANILELSFYDELEEQAKNSAKQQETEKVQLESSIDDISIELVQKPAYEATFETAQRELSRIETVIEEQESRLDHLRKEKETLKSKKLQLKQMEEHIQESEIDIKRWDEQAAQHRSRLKEYEQLFARRSTIEEGYTQLTDAHKQNNELSQKLGLLVKLRDRKSQLDIAITQAAQAMVADHRLTQSRIGELELTSQKLPRLKNEQQQVQTQLHQLAGQEERLRGKRQASQELQAQVNRLETSQIQLTREIGEIEGKLNLISTQSEAKCPLCETELGRESLELIEAKYTAAKLNKSDSLESYQAELTHKITGLESLEMEIFRLEPKLDQDRASVQGKTGLLSKEVAEAEEAATKLTEESKKLGEIEQHLARRDFAPVEQEALGRLEGELAKLDYAPEQHEEVRQRLTDLEQYESPKRKLEEADRIVSQETETLSRAERAAQEIRQSLEAYNQKRQELTLALDVLPRLATDLAQAETEHQALAIKQKQAQETVGSVKGRLERCSELEIKKEEKEKALSQVSREEIIYKDLAQAFGNKGIQALLIEMALPDIEVEANRLLGRMTDNRMHVKIETQRETKKGDLQETLDINIADEMGTRNYEMFSGGEAFRIDFAIRIALSKLLARRAGAPLPTLIIDEGFGTQDSTGIEKLKEAISSIQDDFQKILVITHIEELKDAFLARIDVIKTAEGSTLSIG